MSAQPEFAPLTQTQEFISAEEISRRIIERRLSFLHWFAILSAPEGLTGWRRVGDGPDPEPVSDEDIE